MIEEVNVYILQNIYKNTKPMSEWKFDPMGVTISQTNVPQEN